MPVRTSQEAVLQAATELSATYPEFTMPMIVMRAWTVAPERLGLEGWRNVHPDSHKVASVVNALLNLGMLARVRPSVYRLTNMGSGQDQRNQQQRARMESFGARR